MKLKRRSVLKGIGAAALAPKLASCDPSETPMAVTPALLRERIKTVVVVMMENRSFDHALGALTLEEGRTEIDGLVAGMSNARADGVVATIHPADQNCVQDPGHGWSSSHTQWNGGANDGFVRDYETRTGPDGAHRCMGYLTRDLQPVTHALVDQAALCQRWFCSVLGPTWPNRYYSQLASSDGNHSNDLIQDQTLPSVYRRLDQARIPWTSYYGNIPFSSILPNHSIEDDEYQRLDQFFEDAAAGTLRSLVWIDPVYGRADDHPPAHPLAGQLLLGSIYEALRTSPQWNESLLIITYDEHGGFFDHVPPPPVEDVRAADGFTEMGFRVPALVVGPYVRPQVSSTVFDHTSLIATVLRLHELEPLNVRDESANDVFSLLDEDRLLAEEPRAGEKLPSFEVDDSEIYAEGCVTGLPFHAPLDETFTGQPELDAAFVAKYGPSHPKDLRFETARTMSLLRERARALGVIR